MTTEAMRVKTSSYVKAERLMRKTPPISPAIFELFTAALPPGVMTSAAHYTTRLSAKQAGRVMSCPGQSTR